MSAAIRCRHLHRQRGLPRLQGGSGAGRDSACCAGRLRPPPPWDRSDSAAAVLRGRRPRARWARSAAFPSGSAKARIWRILGFKFTNVLAPAEGLHGGHRRIRARYSDFGYLLVWGYIADLSMVPRLRRGRLAGRALSHPFILRGQKLQTDELTRPLRVESGRTSSPGEGPSQCHRGKARRSGSRITATFDREGHASPSLERSRRRGGASRGR